MVCGLHYNGEEYFYDRDISGNINKIIDKEGLVMVEYEYDAYGVPRAYTGILVPAARDNESDILILNNIFLYKGYCYDNETGLYYLNSRYYDPEVGRWISPDSIDYLDPRSISGLNLYSYCFNNPIMYLDSAGSFPIHIFVIMGIIILAAQRGHQGNQRLTKYRNWTDQDVIDAYEELARKGRLTKEEQQEYEDLKTELKARGLANKAKRKGYSHAKILLDYNVSFIPINAPSFINITNSPSYYLNPSFMDGVITSFSNVSSSLSNWWNGFSTGDKIGIVIVGIVIIVVVVLLIIYAPWTLFGLLFA